MKYSTYSKWLAITTFLDYEDDINADIVMNDILKMKRSRLGTFTDKNDKIISRLKSYGLTVKPLFKSAESDMFSLLDTIIYCWNKSGFSLDDFK